MTFRLSVYSRPLTLLSERIAGRMLNCYVSIQWKINYQMTLEDVP